MLEKRKIFDAKDLAPAPSPGPNSTTQSLTPISSRAPSPTLQGSLYDKSPPISTRIQLQETSYQNPNLAPISPKIQQQESHHQGPDSPQMSPSVQLQGSYHQEPNSPVISPRNQLHKSSHLEPNSPVISPKIEQQEPSNNKENSSPLSSRIQLQATFYPESDSPQISPRIHIQEASYPKSNSPQISPRILISKNQLDHSRPKTDSFSPKPSKQEQTTDLTREQPPILASPISNPNMAYQKNLTTSQPYLDPKSQVNNLSITSKETQLISPVDASNNDPSKHISVNIIKKI